LPYLPFGALDQFLGESGYCITLACKAAHFRSGAGVEIESDAYLLAIDTKTAFTVASLPFALVKVTDRAPAVLKNYTITGHRPEASLESLAAGVRRRAADRGKFFRWAERDGLQCVLFAHWCTELFWLYLITALLGDDSSIRCSNIA
jgi:hypothetical protein